MPQKPTTEKRTLTVTFIRDHRGQLSTAVKGPRKGRSIQRKDVFELLFKSQLAIPLRIWTEIEMLAEADSRSWSSQARLILEDWVRRHKEGKL